MVHDQLRDDAKATAVGRHDQVVKVLQAAIGRLDAHVVGDVVAVVALRAGVGRQEPQYADAQLLDVVELFDQTPEVADPIVVAVKERFDVELVQNRVLVPERIVRTGNVTAGAGNGR